jgi:hypothetical protein
MRITGLFLCFCTESTGIVGDEVRMAPFCWLASAVSFVLTTSEASAP